MTQQLQDGGIIWGTFFKFVMVETPELRWNFDAIYHSSREISTSGLGGHIAISGCRSFSRSLLFELAMVDNPRMQLETNKFVVFLHKLATRVRKNRNAIRGLSKNKIYRRDRQFPAKY